MKTDTASKIIEYISLRGQATGKELASHLALSDRAIWLQISNLLKKGLIKKVGKSPKVFYVLKTEEEEYKLARLLDSLQEAIIDESYLIITPVGEEKKGIEGFNYWCKKQNLPLEKTAMEYVRALKKYNAYMKNDLVDGIKKMKSTFKTVYLDNIYYLDFYSIERFGKTKLGQMLLYAKQSQSRNYINKLIELVKPKIEKTIKKFNIDCVGFIPPTVKREIQIMKELEKKLQLKTLKLNLVKIKTNVIVPQKTLNKLSDREENARNTIVVDDNNTYKNILLIDDAVGSGATLNETAKKIKDRKNCRGKIIGLAIVGSFKGFDVISEV